jgi:outer membrane protein assembly factor BamD
MEIGRWYQRQNQLQAAIGRFRSVIDQYQTTSHTPEALYRLVECYAALGLTDEAKRNAAVLGHNFPGSPWYQDAYALVGGDPTAKPADASQPGFLERAWDRVF